MISCQTRKTSFGPVSLCVESGYITRLMFGSNDVSHLKKRNESDVSAVVSETIQLNDLPESPLSQGDSALLDQAFIQLEEYFAGKR
ncbi:MAG: hypothetical protein PHQ75_14330, partial [Thermoguttaceae bacterium]|nr:hypothetical protein [Thermoguttaceae bacterium]